MRISPLKWETVTIDRRAISVKVGNQVKQGGAMPSSGGYYYGFWEENPRLWGQCRSDATKQMVAEGWKTYANKFDQVMQKRAIKLWKRSK